MQMQAKAGLLVQVRGMKVRSSVKKLCDGCKVCFFSSSFRSLGEQGIGRGVDVQVTDTDGCHVECQAEGVCVYHLQQESQA